MPETRHTIEDVLILALSGVSKNEICKRTGFSSVKVRSIFADEKFQNRLKSAQKDIFDETVSYLKKCSKKAAETLYELMIKPSSNPYVKINCANGILSWNKNYCELSDVIEKLEGIEYKVKIHDNKN